MVKIDHIGIAVNSLSDAIPIYSSILGRKPTGQEAVPREQVRVAFYETEGPRIELLEPTDEGSPVARFLERRGPGLHHICLAVPDLASALERALAAGFEPIPPGIRTGAAGGSVAFLHPRDTGGVLLELAERPPGAG